MLNKIKVRNRWCKKFLFFLSIEKSGSTLKSPDRTSGYNLLTSVKMDPKVKLNTLEGEKHSLAVLEAQHCLIHSNSWVNIKIYAKVKIFFIPTTIFYKSSNGKWFKILNLKCENWILILILTFALFILQVLVSIKSMLVLYKSFKNYT